MNWAEPWAAVNTDLDLFIINQTARCVPDRLDDRQHRRGAVSMTFEIFAGTQNNPGGYQWAFVVARKSLAAPATTPRFKIVFADNGVQSVQRPWSSEVPAAGTGDVMGPTAFGHNGGADVMSVGRVRRPGARRT